MPQTTVDVTTGSRRIGAMSATGTWLGEGHTIVSSDPSNNIIGNIAVCRDSTLGQTVVQAGGLLQKDYAGILVGSQSTPNYAPLGEASRVVPNGTKVDVLTLGTVNVLLQTPSGEAPPEVGFYVYFDMTTGVLIAFDPAGVIPGTVLKAKAQVVTQPIVLEAGETTKYEATINVRLSYDS
jgi:hypothetical protein